MLDVAVCIAESRFSLHQVKEGVGALDRKVERKA